MVLGNKFDNIKFTQQKIKEMSEYFIESSDMGKLYINYPMVESFYHMRMIPDEAYYERCVYRDELIQHKYKERVRQESRGNDYRKFAVDRKDFNTVILQNVNKAKIISKFANSDLQTMPSTGQILSV